MTTSTKRSAPTGSAISGKKSYRAGRNPRPLTFLALVLFQYNSSAKYLKQAVYFFGCAKLTIEGKNGIKEVTIELFSVKNLNNPRLLQKCGEK